MTSPIVTDGSYPCKGFIGQGYDQGTIPTFSAGNTIPVKLSGTAVHGGGCEFLRCFRDSFNKEQPLKIGFSLYLVFSMPAVAFIR